MNCMSWKQDHVVFMRLFVRAVAAWRAVAPRLVRAVRCVYWLIRGRMPARSSRRKDEKTNTADARFMGLGEHG